MNEGITINGKHSYNDFDLYINERTIGQPQKRSIRQTVPFLNGFYDFTKINGEPSWEQREISYVFDIVGDTIEDMDALRDQINNWLLNVHDVDIYDDTIPDYHFHGSLENSKVREEGEKVELEVTFICYPFKIANNMTEQVLAAGNHTINNLGQTVRINALGSAEDMTVEINGSIISVGLTEIELPELLARGSNEIIITGTGTVILSWRNEVM